MMLLEKPITCQQTHFRKTYDNPLDAIGTSLYSHHLLASVPLNIYEKKQK